MRVAASGEISQKAMIALIGNSEFGSEFPKAAWVVGQTQEKNQHAYRNLLQRGHMSIFRLPASYLTSNDDNSSS